LKFGGQVKHFFLSEFETVKRQRKGNHECFWVQLFPQHDFLHCVG